VHSERKVNMNERVGCFEPLPHQLDATETVDDPFVSGKHPRMRLKVFLVRDLNASGSELKLINHYER
jgi:hypothetical protein